MTLLAKDILSFWAGLPEKAWYVADDAVDDAIRSRFEPLWQQAAAGQPLFLGSSPEATLARLILLDQFPRNLFRGQAAAFATDALAREVAKAAIAAGKPLAVDGPLRQFFFMPLCHSEHGADQAMSVRQFLLHFPAPDTLLHARAHRAVIRSFGRFPFRNAALSRANTPAEDAFLAQGGYASVVEQMRG